MRFDVLDSQGWSRGFAVNKRIAYVGSSAANDVVLDSARAPASATAEGGMVQARHVQLIDVGLFSADTRPIYQLVNLADQKILIKTQAGVERTVEGLNAVQVMTGERICLGGFEVTLLADQANDGVADATAPTIPASSRNPIGLEVVLPSTTLRPNQTIACQVRIRNDGSNNAVQFVIAIEGLPREGYSLNGAAPQLFPGRSDTLELLLQHPCSPAFLVGPREFVVRVSAPKDYTYTAEVRCKIDVAPCYRHRLIAKQNADVERAAAPTP